MTSRDRVVLLIEDTLVALDLRSAIADMFPGVEVVTMAEPPAAPEAVDLPGLLALIAGRLEARSIDLERISRAGVAVVVLGDDDPQDHPGIAHLPLPFTTEMLTSVLRAVTRSDPV